MVDRHPLYEVSQSLPLTVFLPGCARGFVPLDLAQQLRSFRSAIIHKCFYVLLKAIDGILHLHIECLCLA